MAERFKAIVRRRNASDDEGCEPEDIWPAELQWISETNHWEDDTWTSGCLSPFETHAEALADAIKDADEVRANNARWATEEETDG